MKHFLTLLFFVLASCSSPTNPVNPNGPPVVPVNPDAPKHATGFLYHPGQKGLIAGKPFAQPTITVELAKSFSWVKAGFGTPVRDQSSCGSCYCFGSLQMLDGALKIYGGKDVTLSEQQCTAYSGFYGCGGGDFAYDILKSGLVTDAKCPYHADGRGCPGGKPTSFDAKAQDAMNLGDGNASPSVPMVKQAIMQYGVVACDVGATSAWDGYSGGILKGGSAGINHIVAVTGWDDATGTWEMKNSWGSSWGEAGYARVPYGDFSLCNDVAFVQYSSTPAFTVIK